MGISENFVYFKLFQSVKFRSSNDFSYILWVFANFASNRKAYTKILYNLKSVYIYIHTFEVGGNCLMLNKFRKQLT